MIKFLGLNVFYGSRGTIASYWSTLSIYKNEVASNTMSKNCFQELPNKRFVNN